VRIVIGEDSAVVREGLALLLVQAGHDVVARVADAPAVVAAVLEHDPDLLVTDIRMPPTMTDDGAKAARELRSMRPGLPVVLLSQHVETTQSTELVATGAFGYLLKDRILDLDDFLDALRRVAAGGSALDPEVVASLLAPMRPEPAFAQLSEREREVLGLLAEGRSNAAAARRLHTTERTVETHVRHIFVKLGLYDSEEDHRRVRAVLAYLRNSS
jgi:DNA-binding NarL/FixJ family response regulator